MSVSKPLSGTIAAESDASGSLSTSSSLAGVVSSMSSSSGWITSGIYTPEQIANAVWSHSSGLSVVKLLGNKVVRVGDVITVYESDNVTIWRQYDLSNGGRVLV
jgi:hypothetical protein